MSESLQKTELVDRTQEISPTISAEAVLKRVREERGGMDLRDLTAQEMAGLCTWYKSAFTTISEKEQAELLEQFMLHGAITDEEAASYIAQMDLEEQAVVGEFIGKVLRPNLFVRAFWECWESLPDTVRRDCIVRFTKTQPEGALMVAAFCDLTARHRRIAKKEDGAMGEETSLLEAQFGTFENAEQLISYGLAYWETHPDSYSAYGLARNIPELYPAFLLPHLEKLKQLRFLTDKDILTMLNTEKITYLDPARFTSQAEQLRIADLKKKAQRYRQQHDKTAAAEQEVLYDLDDVKPQAYRVALEKIDDTISERAAKILLGNFQAYKSLLDNPERFLLNCLDGGYPVFAAAGSLGLSHEELRHVVMRAKQEGSVFNLRYLGDLKELLAHNRRTAASDKEDLEEAVMQYAKQEFSDHGAYSTFGESLVAYDPEGVLQELRSENRTVLLNLINKKALGLWMQNLAYALEHAVLPLQEILEAAGDDQFLEKHHELLYMLGRAAYANKEVGFTVAKLRQWVKDIFENRPEYFLHNHLRQIAQEHFSPSEIHQLLGQELAESIDPRLFFRLLAASDAKKYLPQCAELLRTNKNLFITATQEEHDWNRAKKLLASDERFAYILKYLDRINPETVLQDKDLLLACARSEKKFQQLIARIVQINEPSLLVRVLCALDGERTSRVRAAANRKNSLADTKSEIDRLQFRLRGEPDPAEKKKIQENIGRARSMLATIQKERLPDLPTREQQALVRMRQALCTALADACEKIPFLAFDDNILTIEGFDSRPYRQRDIEAYASMHPEELLRIPYKQKNLIYKDFLGEERFAELLKAHTRSLVYKHSRYGERPYRGITLPEDTRMQLEVVNPFFAVEQQQRLTQDYYALMLECIFPFHFFPVYETRLRAIAQKEQQTYGPQLDLKNFKPQEEFLKLANRVALLEHCPFAILNSEAIRDLDAEKREKILQHIEFLAQYDIDPETPPHAVPGKDNGELFAAVERLMAAFAKKVFTMEDIEDALPDSLDPETLQALIVYYQQTCERNPAMLNAFSQFIRQAIRNNYPEWRWWGDPQSAEPMDGAMRFDALKQARLIPAAMTLAQYATWRQTDIREVEEVLEFSLADVRRGIQDILDQAVRDGHVGQEVIAKDPVAWQARYRELIAPLATMTQRMQELQEQFSQAKKRAHDPKIEIVPEFTEQDTREYGALQQNIRTYRQAQEAELLRVQAFLHLDALKTLHVKDLEDRMLTGETRRVAFTEVFRTLHKAFAYTYPDFANDMLRISHVVEDGRRSMFGEERMSRSRLAMTDRLDLGVYARVGEKPVNTCQHYDSSSRLNEGLLSYLVDPQVKILQLYNAEEQLIARAVIRLMGNRAGSPVLYLERVYSANPHPKIPQAMREFFNQKAKVMGVLAYTEGEKSGHRERLYNFASRSPFVYTDAGGGKVAGGEFSLEVE